MKHTGTVSEALTNGQFKVLLDEGITVRCYLAGKLVMNRIWVIVGDTVDLELPKGSDIGRILYRKNKKFDKGL